MKDKGIIVSLNSSFAEIELNCFSGCQKCEARQFCSGKEQKKGFINALNPVKAELGDEVMIEVPDRLYSRTLILLFGFWLLASLCGMFGGYFIANPLSLPSSTGAILGFFVGLVITGFLLFSCFKKNKINLYPKITNIIKKGDYHE